MGGNGDGWSLEVVRGRGAGRIYALGRGATVLGNALGGVPGLDLASHEGDSPRRMASRQAQIDIDLAAPVPTLRDLDSPGGTFVNRRRLLPGQALALQAEDLIQLGGVQLRVIAAAPGPTTRSPAATDVATKSLPAPIPVAPKPARPSGQAATTRPAVSPATPPMSPPSTAARPAPPGGVVPSGAFPSAFTLESGARCRTWDDFLTVAAQRWEALRDELVSGRIAAFLTAIGRSEMAPSPRAAGTPDERLDAWLGSLPTSRPSRPELDVHPAVLTLRAAPGGGVLRASLRVANTGYRLLRTSVRVEPASATWIKLPASLATGPLVTVDQTPLPIEVQVPEAFDASPTAALVFDSNGGTRRVEVRLERPDASWAIPDATGAPAGPTGIGLPELIARMPIGTRLAVGVAGGLLLRGLVAGAVVAFGAGADGARPPLQAVAVLLAIVGCVAAGLFAIRRGGPGDVPAAGFAGGFAGVLVAALLVAACRTVEPRLLPGTGPGASPFSACLLWGILGAVLAVVSALLVPPRPVEEVSS